MASKQEQSAEAVFLPDAIRNYVGGEWVGSRGDESYPVVNPATDDELGQVPFSTAEDVDLAVQSATEAFDDWRRTPPVDRAQYLFDLKDELEDRQEDIAQALTREHGKTLVEARGEIRRGIENVEVAAGILNMLREQSGLVEDVARDMDESAVRQP